MTLAKKCGLRVPDVEIVKVLDRDIFLIRRFDRIGGSEMGTYHRLHFNSALTILNAHESESSRRSYEEIADIVRRFSADPKGDCRELYKRMIFNILVNNNDDHLRNHGFLLNGTHWNLSPLYDVVPNVQISLERDLAIGVGTQGRRATLANALSRSAAFYLSKDEAKNEIQKMQSIVLEWKNHFIQSGFTVKKADDFQSCFIAVDEPV